MSKLLSVLIKVTAQPILFPFYHIVSDEDLPYIKHLYPIKKVETFKKEIDFLLNNFKAISLEELIAYQKGEITFNQPCFFLSFDDGFRQCYDIIAPILLAKGVPATFFVNADFIDNRDLMYRNKLSYLLDKGVLKTKDDFSNYNFAQISEIDAVAQMNNINFDELLKNQKIYMTLAQLKSLRTMGFSIGAHSQSHPYYRDITLEKQIDQTTRSIAFVKENIKEQELTAFAFPFDDIGVRTSFFEKLKPSVDAFFTAGGIKKDVLANVYRRLDMENQSNIEKFILGSYSKYLIKSLLKYKHIYHRNA